MNTTLVISLAVCTLLALFILVKYNIIKSVGPAGMDWGKAAKDSFQYILAALIIAVLVYVLRGLMSTPIPPDNAKELDIVLGVLAGAFTTVVGFFFGSSKGSSEKNDTIDKALNTPMWFLALFLLAGSAMAATINPVVPATINTGKTVISVPTAQRTALPQSRQGTVYGYIHHTGVAYNFDPQAQTVQLLGTTGNSVTVQGAQKGTVAQPLFSNQAYDLDFTPVATFTATATYTVTATPTNTPTNTPVNTPTNTPTPSLANLQARIAAQAVPINTMVAQYNATTQGSPAPTVAP